MRLISGVLALFGGVVPVAAQQAAAPAGGGMDMVTMVLMFGSMFGIIFFLMIRPEQKKQKERQKLMQTLTKGDKVVTIGGIHGKVVQVKEQTVLVKVSDTTTLEFTKSAISTVDRKETAAKEDSKVKVEKSEEQS
jgi:preprotein translocase subunit YajC